MRPAVWLLAALLLHTVAGAAPAVPKLLSPIDGTSTTLIFPRFFWERLPGTLDIKAPLLYEIEIARDANFTEVADKDAVNLARYVPDQPLEAGTYHWRVRAKTDAGEAGEWSPAGQFVLRGADQVIKAELVEGTDTLPQLRKAVTEAIALTKQGKVVRVEVPKGNYVVQPKPAEKELIKLSGVNNLTIDFGGASFAIKRWGVALANLNRSKNITLMNAEVDSDAELAFTQAIVQSVDAATGDVVVKIEPGYPEFDAPWFKRGVGFAILMDPKIPGRMKAGAPIHFTFHKDKYEKVGERTWKLPLQNVATAEYIVAGDRFVSFARDGGGASLVGSNDSEGLSYYKITSYSTGGGGHYVEIHGNDVAILHCRQLVKEGRWFGGNADGVHLKSHKLGPWIEGLEVDGIGDDAIALYTRPAKIHEAHVGGNPRVFICYNDFFNLEAGENVVFFEPLAGKFFAEANVEKVEKQGDKWLVTFDRDLPKPEKIGPDKSQTAQIWNRSKTCGDFMIRGCNIRNVRRFGAVFRAPRGVVEDNSFVGTSSSGVLFLNEPWYPNGPMASDILIQRNKFSMNNLDTSIRYGAIGMVLRKYPHAFADGQGPYNFLIRNNEISDWQRHAILLSGAKDVRVVDNKIGSMGGAFVHDENVAIKVQNSSNIELKGNTINDSRAPYVKYEATESTVQTDMN